MNADLIQRLRAFASGCRGSMWQSRDETIQLCDAAADALTSAQEENERLVHDIERLSASLSAEVTGSERLRVLLNSVLSVDEALGTRGTVHEMARAALNETPNRRNDND